MLVDKVIVIVVVVPKQDFVIYLVIMNVEIIYEVVIKVIVQVKKDYIFKLIQHLINYYEVLN